MGMKDPQDAYRDAESFSMHNIDVQKFMDALDHCKGNVYLITEEGDRLNLKSKLSQVAGLIRLIEGGKLLQAHIVCDDPEDEAYLFRMNLFGDAKE